jgi:hypothetical protein
MALACASIASATLAAASVADAPPVAGHKITVHPVRDSVVGTGYTAGLPAVVTVLRYDAATQSFHVISRSHPIDPQDDPETAGVFDGIVAVNRADGGCWRRVTPDIRSGDRVRIVQRDDAGEVVNNDSTVTGSVSGGVPQFVFDAVRGRPFAEVHGTAPRINLRTGEPVPGARVPLAQLEVRIVNDDGFATNGRRALVTSQDGTLRYDSADPADARWTARFPVRAIDQEEVEDATTRAMWLGREPEDRTELTVAENRAGGIGGGPRAGCQAPAEGSPEAESLAPDADPPEEPVE